MGAGMAYFRFRRSTEVKPRSTEVKRRFIEVEPRSTEVGWFLRTDYLRQ